MSRQASRSAALVYAGQLSALVLVCVVSGRLAPAIVPFGWLPAGVALAALVAGGRRLWPGVAAGALLSSLWAGTPLLVAGGVALGGALGAVVGAAILGRAPGFHGSFERFSEVVWLAAAAAVGSAVSATVGAASLAPAGLSAMDLARAWRVWWAGDLVGGLVLAPFVWTWTQRTQGTRRPGTIGEAAALGAFLAGCAALVCFSDRPTWLLCPHLLLLPVIWAAVRFGARGAAAAVLAVALATSGSTALGRGMFARVDGAESLVALDVLLVTASLAALSVASVVSAYQRSCEALSAGEALLRAIVEGTPDSIYAKDRRGRYLIANTALANSYGVPVEALPGKDPADFLPAAQARRLREVDEEVLRTGESRRVEASVTNADGSVHVYDTIKAPYRDGAGNLLGIMGISRDVTEHKSAEATRAWLAAIVESSSDAIIGKAIDGTITSWNAAAERLYGYARDEAVGQPITMIVPLEEHGQLARLFERLRRGEQVEEHETVRVCKGGRRIAVALTLSPIRDAAGTVIGASAIARDLTDSAELARLAGEAAQLGMWFWHMRDDRLVWTPLCRRLFGIGPDEAMTYARWLAAVHPEDRARCDAAVRRAIADHDDFHIEHRAVWPDGTVRWLEGRGRALYDVAGAPVRMVGTTLDVTAQKQADHGRAELYARAEAARAEAQAATQAKDAFLAFLSHELRTPLQSMLGWTLMLKGRLHDVPSAQKGLAAIERNVRVQARLIEDLLDVSRIVAGKLRLSRERVDLAEVVHAALESARGPAADKRVRLEAAPSPRCEVLGDPVRLQQVVSNLLTNAVKFTPPGGRVGVRLEREGATARIVVEDTGRGVSADLLPQIFDRFRQAERTTVDAHGGLGLGLAIVRHLAELHGGSVRAESPGEGRGATFTVTLPLACADHPAVAPALPRAAGGGPAAPVALDGLRVLVVDDDPDAREMLDAALHEAGAEVRAVDSVRAAVDALGAFQPQLLLSDIGMPGEDGYALIRQVREREAAGGGHVPALALTAFASQADREQALALGYDRYLAKPVAPDDLLAAVANLVRKAA